MDYSNLRGKRILVTGASGFIGSHLAIELCALGADLYVTQHYNPPFIGKVYQCNLANNEQVNDLIFDVKPEFVFHLAAQAIVTDGEHRAKETLDTNVGGTINLLHALYQMSLDYPENLYGVIVAATDKVYGRQDKLPYTEDMPLLGVQQVYEASKTCEDVLAQMAAWAWKLPIAITRFGNVYGPGDHNETRIIPGTIIAYLRDESPIIRSDGQAYRDYIYIDDVVDGYLRLAEFVADHSYVESGLGPDIFNFGTGKFSRVLDVVAAISEYFPHAKPPIIQYSAQDEIRRQYVSGAWAKQMLGWEPKVFLRDGIAETVKYWKEQYA